MALTDDERLLVSVEARITDFEKNFLKASRTARTNWSDINAYTQRGARRLESTMAQATRGVSEKFRLMATSAAGALTAALGVNQLKRWADEWTSARSKIAAAGEELDDVAARQSQLTDLAIRSRADLGATVDLYTSLKRATESLGANQAQVLQVTETINKAFAVSGASSSTAAGAILQLGQAFASGALRGDELNSVLEGAPPLARLIAKEMGVSVGQLKQLGSEGKLTADRVFQALLNGSKAVQEEFARTTPTVSQALSILQTSLARYVGELDQATGASAAISGALVTMAEHANVTGPALAAIAAGLAAAFAGGPVIGGITAATVAVAAFGSQIQPIAGELASLGDYAAAAWNMIKDGADAVATDLQARFIQAAELISAALGDLDFGKFLAAVKSVANATIGAFVASAKAIQTSWSALGVSIANSVVGAMNAVIAAAERAANAVASVASAASGGFFQPGRIDLGRLRSDFGDAGEIAGKGFGEALAAANQDYIGAATKPMADALAKLRDDANKRAAARAGAPVTLNDGSLSSPLKRSPATATGAGKSKAAHENEFQKEVASLERQARAYDSEREALGKLTIEQDRAKASLELFEAAKRAGLTVDDALRAKIDATADAYARAKDAFDTARQSQEEFQSALAGFGDDLKQGLADAVIEGRRLDEVLQSIVKRLANKALGSAFDGIFGAVTKGLTGAGGGLLSGLLPKFAGGGMIRGPGGGTSDSILAAVSNGEYIVPAEATRKFLPILEAIRSGHLPRFAAGGVIGSAPAISAPSFSAPGMGSSPVHISSNVTVNAQGGDGAANADLAAQTSRAVERQLRGIVADEIFKQSRVGRTLATRFGG
jgi:tape measure domain-containing protein